MAGGRPTSYEDRFVQAVDEYLEQYESFNEVVPSVPGFCRFINRAKSSVYKWCDEHPEFSDAFKRIGEAQHIALLSGGLSGTYNPTIAKLVMSSNHGYSEKTETKADVTSNGETLQPTVIRLVGGDE